MKTNTKLFFTPAFSGCSAITEAGEVATCGGGVFLLIYHFNHNQ